MTQIQNVNTFITCVHNHAFNQKHTFTLWQTTVVRLLFYPNLWGEQLYLVNHHTQCAVLFIQPGHSHAPLMQLLVFPWERLQHWKRIFFLPICHSNMYLYVWAIHTHLGETTPWVILVTSSITISRSTDWRFYAFPLVGGVQVTTKVVVQRRFYNIEGCKCVSVLTLQSTSSQWRTSFLPVHHALFHSKLYL